ncbi:PHA/PHB synthase family protein [Beggiatoa leptomitoformis]|uniref:Class I poly(R)-hydroxyalkanoic acid synthase n=1 Tax=Beggiatoa leptomitoformis TaxID=288004 RepID=A0A2N9YC44_9GAMM|nr:class I poly(R)-hydroxyalkanoic acid synthase [Beggiatoa leptomitoformis]ALG66669.1 class I poly(R)-hydroxyalkanoic acid synthase [Beggiatoa leptomitoformis]AUI68009.1 class I poly(R)-hydroxyalkanoic acid synthase [Beggiatoa leptomitoformis]
MTTQQLYQTPKELLEKFNKLTNEWMEGFGTNQSQEMLKQFTNAWNAIASQSAQDPQKWMDIITQYQQAQMQLWMNVMGAPMGGERKAVATPDPTDRRFSAKEWEENPVFDYLKQSYLLASNLLMQSAERAQLDDDNKRKLQFYTKYFIDAMSPTNFATTNPEVIKQVVETKGQSLLDGLKNLLGDLEKGRISMTDESAFKLGKNIAVTQGAVVYESDIMQVVQYKPTTETVLDKPIVIVPPCINKFYILDLQPDNSFIKYAVDQGNNVFVISWMNPDEKLSQLAWDDYVDKGVLKAFDVAKEVTGAKKINAVSWCVGGTILATALAVLHARKKQAIVNSATFFTTMLDFSDPGELGVFIDEMQFMQRESQLKHKGYLSGKDLATAFSMLRANDLIWSYVVNNYLKGQTPAPFDILYWNSDPTNLPAKMYTYYLRNMYLDNKLIEPDALTLCNAPINLRNIKTPSYFLSTIDDHIAPWKTTFTATELFSGPLEFVLGASGHIAGVINPASKNKRNYWMGGEKGKGAAHWLDTAQSQKGSWWNHWSQWLKAQGGEQVPAPKELGSKDYAVIEPAPGRYVAKRVD